MKQENSYQKNIVTIFDNKMKPIIPGLMPNTLTEEQVVDRIEAMRDFMTTLSYDYNQENSVSYDEAKHMVKVPSVLKENPASNDFDLQHDLVQLTVSSICPVRDKEVLPYMNLYADSLATVMVGDITLEKNPNRYDKLENLGKQGMELLNGAFYTGNQEMLQALKQVIGTTYTNQEVASFENETAKTRG
ncbi:MAG: hypothetical protein KH135_00145 [Firmicutes bacterium]|nr:hypothetical protein [Bacillota bacterium]